MGLVSEFNWNSIQFNGLHIPSIGYLLLILYIFLGSVLYRKL